MVEHRTSSGGLEDGKKTIQLRPNSLFEYDKNVGPVIVGLDKNINYYKLLYATLCIRQIIVSEPGCLFIATNRDTVGHFTGVQEWLGAGCMVAAICESVQKEPVIVGKPSTFMMDFLLERGNYWVRTSDTSYRSVLHSTEHTELGT
ncbi:phosphoglycolate phosphatase 2-like [Dendrobium catenatum]|uniref:phosphoglycolate phosphatase 2-like n=1 Tax=Dendrobium catenatum TaxID=906689 RepID=UPI0009F24285|nr:phosphoglycolate phosphatase 2-like [Dendrobium catenatum]